MENGIERKKFDSAVKQVIDKEIIRVVEHINTHDFVRAEYLNGNLKLYSLKDFELSKEQSENIIGLFKKGGIVKSKDKEKEYFNIKPLKGNS